MTLVERLRAQDMGRMEMLRALEEAATRIEELESVLRELLQHVSGLRDELPMKDTRANHELLLMLGDRARSALNRARGEQ